MPARRPALPSRAHFIPAFFPTLSLQAAMKGEVAAVRALLGAGAAPSAPNSEGRTPLMWAAGSGHLGAAEALLAAGASPAEKDAKGDSALHYAAWVRGLGVRGGCSFPPACCSPLAQYWLLARS